MSAGFAAHGRRPPGDPAARQLATERADNARAPIEPGSARSVDLYAAEAMSSGPRGVALYAPTRDRERRSGATFVLSRWPAPVSPGRQSQDERPGDVIRNPRRDYSSHRTLLGGSSGRTTRLERRAVGVRTWPGHRLDGRCRDRRLDAVSGRDRKRRITAAATVARAVCHWLSPMRSRINVLIGPGVSW